MDELLNNFKASKQHLFIVLDKFGNVLGLVTIEDILEEIIGAEIMDEYDQLWTTERMERVVKVLADNNVALEINARYKTPNAAMIKMAKAAGVKFAFGTNNTGRNLGRLEYCIEMIRECKLSPNDMFEIKPDAEKPIRVKGLPNHITG